MTVVDASLEYQRLRAPQEDGQALLSPPLADAPTLIANNEDQLIDRDAGGETWKRSHFGEANYRNEAQRSLLDLAYQYTSQYSDPSFVERVAQKSSSSPSDSNGNPTLVMSGHQPELFHPGVWFKNFCLSSIATATNSVAVNLIIDNDLCQRPGIQVPAGTLDSPRWSFVASDQATAIPEPWETRRVHDVDLLLSFEQRVRSELISEVRPDLLKETWAYATDRRFENWTLGARLAAARHLVERRAGLSTLEVPLSQVVQTQSFARFTATLIEQSDRFQRIHNDSLTEYRRIHHLRSRTHPVPDLVREADWIELPFWIWTSQQPERNHLFVARRGDHWHLSDRKSVEIQLSAQRLDEGLFELAERGIALRPRALMTTMYSRLLLGSLFLHGIGGAKYDQLTDVLISRFWKVKPPSFLTLTATKRLPIPVADVHPLDLAKIKQQQRELEFHPELFLEDDKGVPSSAKLLADEKFRLIREQPISGSRRQWHLQVTEVNEQMQPYLESRRQQLDEDAARIQELLRSRKILASREMSFVLFGETLIEDLKQMSQLD